MHRRTTGTLLVLGALLLSTRLVAAEKIAVAVLDLKVQGVDPAVGGTLTTLVTQEIERLGLFRTISQDDIRGLLAHEARKELLGCDAGQCLVEIGGALGASLLLTGSVGRIGDTHVIALQLLDVPRALVLHRTEKTVSGAADQLVPAVRQAVRGLLRPLLEKEQGSLSLRCSEEGAEVYIDGRLVGTTPIAEQQLAGGFHELRINKQRFVEHAVEVEVEPRGVRALDVRLVPSRAFVEEYRGAAIRDRVLAWSTGGLALAAAGAALGLFVWNDGRLDEYRLDRDQYVVMRAGDPAELNARAEQINLIDNVTLGVAAGAGVAALASLYFWLVGDPPERYELAAGIAEAP